MTDVIDGGEIIGTEFFAIGPNIDRFTLDSLAFEAVLRLFQQLSPQLTDLENEIAPSGEVWTGKAKTKKDFDKLCELPADLSESEFQRRYRAVGEGPNHALFFHLFGHRFRLENQRDQDTVYRGGHATPDRGSTSS